MMSQPDTSSLPSDANAGSARGYMKRRTSEGAALVSEAHKQKALSPSGKRSLLEGAPGLLIFAGQRLVSHR